MTIYIIIGIILFVACVIALFMNEIKHAPTIDDKEPFLWDDYNPKKQK